MMNWPFKKERKNSGISNDKESAYSTTLEIMREAKIIANLAHFQRDLLEENNLDESIERGMVIAAYRSVGVGAGILYCLMQEQKASKEELNNAYWDFVKNSPIREIASDIFSASKAFTSPPVNIITDEMQELGQCGFDICHYAKTDLLKCNEIWRDGVAGLY